MLEMSLSPETEKVLRELEELLEKDKDITTDVKGLNLPTVWTEANADVLDGVYEKLYNAYYARAGEAGLTGKKANLNQIYQAMRALNFGPIELGDLLITLPSVDEVEDFLDYYADEHHLAKQALERALQYEELTPELRDFFTQSLNDTNDLIAEEAEEESVSGELSEAEASVITKETKELVESPNTTAEDLSEFFNSLTDLERPIASATALESLREGTAEPVSLWEVVRQSGLTEDEIHALFDEQSAKDLAVIFTGLPENEIYDEVNSYVEHLRNQGEVDKAFDLASELYKSVVDPELKAKFRRLSVSAGVSVAPKKEVTVTRKIPPRPGAEKAISITGKAPPKPRAYVLTSATPLNEIADYCKAPANAAKCSDPNYWLTRVPADLRDKVGTIEGATWQELRDDYLAKLTAAGGVDYGSEEYRNDLRALLELATDKRDAGLVDYFQRLYSKEQHARTKNYDEDKVVYGKDNEISINTEIYKAMAKGVGRRGTADDVTTLLKGAADVEPLGEKAAALLVPSIVYGAALGGNDTLLTYLKKTYPSNYNLNDVAKGLAAANKAADLKSLLKANKSVQKITESLMETAAENGAGEVITMLHDNYEADYPDPYFAAVGGFSTLADWIVKQADKKDRPGLVSGILEGLAESKKRDEFRTYREGPYKPKIKEGTVLEAVDSGDIGLVEDIFGEYLSKEGRKEFGPKAFYAAVRNKYPDIMEYLLDKGLVEIEPAKLQLGGYTSDDEKVIDLLLEHGVKKKDLMRKAVTASNPELVAYLTDKGAKLDEEYLEEKAEKITPEFALVLLQAGHDVDTLRDIIAERGNAKQVSAMVVNLEPKELKRLYHLPDVPSKNEKLLKEQYTAKGGKGKIEEEEKKPSKAKAKAKAKGKEKVPRTVTGKIRLSTRRVQARENYPTVGWVLRSRAGREEPVWIYDLPKLVKQMGISKNNLMQLLDRKIVTFNDIKNYLLYLGKVHNVQEADTREKDLYNIIYEKGSKYGKTKHRTTVHAAEEYPSEEEVSESGSTSESGY